MSNSRPNIIYILADDMGYGDLSCLNPNGKIQTTHLDKLAAGGLTCRDAHATSAVCTPSRYSILTGRYNWRSSLKQGVLWGYSPPLIEPGRVTAASLLKSCGYSTACIGKWHLGWHWAKNGPGEEDVDFSQPVGHGPTTVGFDYFFGISGSLDMTPYVYVENDQATAVPDHTVPGGNGKLLQRGGLCAPDFEHQDVLPNLTDKVVKYIESQSKTEQPFFLYFPLTAPHTPILPTEDFIGKSGTTIYGDFCLHLDDVVGQVMAALERCGIADNTIIIFTSDNGCSPQADFAELATFGHNPSHHFRGHKFDIYEGGHRVPYIVRWPNVISAGRTTDRTTCLVDFLATCADITGSVLPADAAEDSFSDLSLWRAEDDARPQRPPVVHSSADGSLSIRRGYWKIEMCPGSGGWSDPKPGPQSAGLPPIQLYDLSIDVGETTNVADKHLAEVEDLMKLLTSYIRNGRSNPGPNQTNVGGTYWEQLWWLAE